MVGEKLGLLYSVNEPTSSRVFLNPPAKIRCSGFRHKWWWLILERGVEELFSSYEDIIQLYCKKAGGDMAVPFTNWRRPTTAPHLWKSMIHTSSSSLTLPLLPPRHPCPTTPDPATHKTNQPLPPWQFHLHLPLFLQPSEALLQRRTGRADP